MGEYNAMTRIIIIIKEEQGKARKNEKEELTYTAQPHSQKRKKERKKEEKKKKENEAEKRAKRKEKRKEKK